MTTYIFRRLLIMIPTLVGVTLLTFLLLRLSPANPAMLRGAGAAEGGHQMTADERQRLVAFYGLDKPILVGYADWLGKTLRGDFSDSFVDHQPVIHVIGERLGLTVSITGAALILSYLLAIPLGVVAAIKRGQVLDRSISFVVFLLYSIPSFAAALLLILFVAGGDYLNLVPMFGIHSLNWREMGFWSSLWDRIYHMILPVVCLTYGSLASISRYARISMLDALGQDFVRTARAKGLPERLVIFRHALRNALIPTITIFVTEIPGLISGAVIIEEIFSLPGMGQLIFRSLDAGDIPVIMGSTLLIAIVTLACYLVGDILYAVVDPRINYE